ncbi:hypothetical protein ACTWP5_23515 [Streptomyces sp. 4N509B]|uniref:hypothetical protein n=1 Tax=Streptomyces sp. 4N509B TaxID=3457413 RepID=UPI003FCFB61C
MTRPVVLRRLDPSIVGAEPCPSCRVRVVKLPGLTHPLCLHCFAAERLPYERQSAAATLYVTACVAGPQCPACGSTRVDADGALWWCEGCGLCTRVAE